MTIREARLPDARAIAGLLREIGELRSVVCGSSEEIIARVESGLALAIPSPQSKIMVAVTTDDQVVAYCAVHWTPFLFLPGPEAYITELFVRPDHRSGGVGTALLREAETKARECGCSRLALLNGKEGESYRRNFYSKRGWIERDKMANFVFPLIEEPNPESSVSAQPETGRLLNKPRNNSRVR